MTQTSLQGPQCTCRNPVTHPDGLALLEPVAVWFLCLASLASTEEGGTQAGASALAKPCQHCLSETSQPPPRSSVLPQFCKEGETEAWEG